METCWDIKDVDRRNWCFANQMANAWKMKDSNPDEVDPKWICIYELLELLSIFI